MRFRTILFDFDGTLIDHFAAIHRAHCHTLRHYGLPEPTLAQVRRVVGRGLESAISDLVGPAHQHIAPEAAKVYRAYWPTTMLDDVVLLPGARELLEWLRARNIQVAIFTNKHGPSSRTISTHLKIDDLVAATYGAHDTPWLKPDLRFTSHVLEQLKADPKATLFVGDSPYDVQAAHNAQLICWCVATGTHTAQELEAAGADAVFPSLADLQSELAHQ